MTGGLAGAEGKLSTDWFDDELVSSVYVRTIFRIIQVREERCISHKRRIFANFRGCAPVEYRTLVSAYFRERLFHDVRE